MSPKQILLTILVSTIAVLLVAVLFSCSALDNAIDSIEESNYQFYYNTKAVFVVKRTPKTLYCQNPQGTRFYKVRQIYPLPDTILLRDNKWVYKQTSFIKNLPE